MTKPPIPVWPWGKGPGTPEEDIRYVYGFGGRIIAKVSHDMIAERINNSVVLTRHPGDLYFKGVMKEPDEP